MARPLRIEYPGAVYHVTARGNERRTIFQDGKDCGKFLDILAEACQRFGVVIHGYVLMGNHYHLLIETPRPNLARVMHYLNATYTGYFNWRHKRGRTSSAGQIQGACDREGAVSAGGEPIYSSESREGRNQWQTGGIPVEQLSGIHRAKQEERMARMRVDTRAICKKPSTGKAVI